jgi:flavin prenyltransferase
MKKIVLAITGASGAAYALRTLQLLAAMNEIEIHLVISPMGRRLLFDELAMTQLPDNIASRVVQHAYNDLGSPLASGSFLHDGMAIVPCSSNTLAQVANGFSGNLIARAAAVTLKERRKLILCHRETPLALTDIKNYEAAAVAGAIIAPANPGFYMNPNSLDDLIDFMAGKILDLLLLPHDLNTRWKPAPMHRETTP